MEGCKANRFAGRLITVPGRTLFESFCNFLMKEFEMPDSNQPSKESTAMVKKTETSLNWGPDSEFQGKLATLLVQNSCTPLEIRLEKVRAIQLLFAEAGYKLDEQQNATLKQLLETLNV